MHPGGGLSRPLEDQHRRDDHVTDDRDGEIGGRIVGAVGRQRQAAAIAGVQDTHIAGEDRPMSAGWAAPANASPKRNGPRLFRHGTRVIGHDQSKAPLWTYNQRLAGRR